MRKRIKFALGGLCIGLAVAYLIVSGTSETATYFLTVTEAASAEGIGQVRVKGRVREGSVVKSPEEVRLTFTLTDNERQIPVFYHGIVPDLFAEGPGGHRRGTSNAARVDRRESPCQLPVEVRATGERRGVSASLSDHRCDSRPVYPLPSEVVSSLNLFWS